MTEQEAFDAWWSEATQVDEKGLVKIPSAPEIWQAALDWARHGQEPVAKTVTGRREVACHGPDRRYVDGIVIRQLKEIEPETNLYAHPAPPTDSSELVDAAKKALEALTLRLCGESVFKIELDAVEILKNALAKWEGKQ